jgi:Flp pilus assembly protein TadG
MNKRCTSSNTPDRPAPARPARNAQRRPDRARGAALVEFALVMPLLFMLLFGIVDFGMQFANINAMRQGTREAARQAVVATFGTENHCSLTGVTPTDSDAAFLICLAKDRIGLADTNVRVKLKFTTTNNVGRTLIVCSMYPMSSISGMFSPLFSGKTIKSKVEMRIEQTDSGLLDTAETPLAGQNWMWCA